MRIMIINTDYPVFLQDLYSDASGLRGASFERQLQERNASLFGVADFYSEAFIRRGHDAWEIHANNAPLQSAWLREHGFRTSSFVSTSPEKRASDWSRYLGVRLGRGVARIHNRLAPPAPAASYPHSPLRPALEPKDIDLTATLLAQARYYRPDVVLNQSVSEVVSWQVRALRPYAKLIVGQIASPLPDDVDYTAYDAMISSLPNFVRHFRELGVRAELNRLGFGKKVADLMPDVARDVDVSFMGSVTPDHGSRFSMLEALAARTDIQIWGRFSDVPEASPLWSKYRGAAWGRDMYSVLGRSKITVNQHIDIAGDHANNMRLYEATGMGAMLLTDWKSDIAEIFRPGEEIVCYRNIDECISLIEYYRTHEQERAKIAAAGRARVLSDHTFDDRAGELIELFSGWVAQTETAERSEPTSASSEWPRL